MSFNVFDESPENQIVIKEQQSQNKVFPIYNTKSLLCRCLLNTFFDLDLCLIVEILVFIWRFGELD